MENKEMKNIKTCCECNEILMPGEKYVCDMCKRMIKEWEKKHKEK